MLSSKRQKRVLILEPAGNLWGSERFLLDFLKSAPTSSWEIGVCCPPKSLIIESLAALPVKVFPNFISHLHEGGRGQRLKAALNLLKTALAFKPQVIFVNQAGATRIALFVGRLLRIPVITHVQLAEDVDYVMALQASARNLPKIVCDSEYIRQLFPDSQGQLSKRLVTMYSPYVPQYDWLQASETVVASETPKFSCVARLAKVKGQDVLLRAVDVLKRQGTEVKVTFVGSATANDNFDVELKELAQTLDVADQVVWAGFQKEVFPFMNGCAAQIICSHVEPLGRVIFEAWDAGIVPVAWKGSGGAAEVTLDSGGGLLYEHQDAQDLAQALLKAVALLPAERQRMVEQGRQWLFDHCDPKKYAEQMLNLCQEVSEAR